ncbi:hypothetical protein [Salinithrix halophila]|uniref:Fimbrial assembly protein (PilN) n=1 Tax=Salinithrix halophila TaxID=1485204 RepID=A0ABV8JFB3_9BACL
MNLMPPESPGRRYFRFGLVIIILWLLHLAAFTAWLWMEQAQTVDRLEQSAKEAMVGHLEAQKKVKERQAFMEQYGPTIRYRDTVEKLTKDRVTWTEALEVIEKALPTGVKLFQAKAEGRRFDGWAVFPTAGEAATFLEALNKEPRVEQAYLDCLGRNCAEKAPLKKAGKEAQLLHFHFVLQGTEAEDATDGGGDSDGP